MNGQLFGFFLSRFNFFRRRFARNLERYVTLVQMGSYAKLVPILTQRQPGDAGYLAVAIINKWFSKPPGNEEGARFAERNVLTIETESERILKEDRELREIIVQALRVDLVRRFTLREDKLIESRTHQDILSKYGAEFPQEPEPKLFRELAEGFCAKYEQVYMASRPKASA